MSGDLQIKVSLMAEQRALFNLIGDNIGGGRTGAPIASGTSQSTVAGPAETSAAASPASHGETERLPEIEPDRSMPRASASLAGLRAPLQASTRRELAAQLASLVFAGETEDASTPVPSARSESLTKVVDEETAVFGEAPTAMQTAQRASRDKVTSPQKTYAAEEPSAEYDVASSAANETVGLTRFGVADSRRTASALNEDALVESGTLGDQTASDEYAAVLGKLMTRSAADAARLSVSVLLGTDFGMSGEGRTDRSGIFKERQIEAAGPADTRFASFLDESNLLSPRDDAAEQVSDISISQEQPTNAASREILLGSAGGDNLSQTATIAARFEQPALGDGAALDAALATAGFAVLGGPDLVPLPERAGVIASFILNAAMIPGWPPPRPIEGVLIRSFAAEITKASLSQTDMEMLLYLANMGFGRKHLRRLMRRLEAARNRSKLLLAFAALITNLKTAATGLREELAALSEEIEDQDDVELSSSFGRRRLSLG